MSRITMRLSDAGLHWRQTKALYLNHRPPPWPHRRREPRDRSNRWLGILITAVRSHISNFCHRYFKAADKFCGGVIEPASQRYED
jgi:hypothetical protein